MHAQLFSVCTLRNKHSWIEIHILDLGNFLCNPSEYTLWKSTTFYISTLFIRTDPGWRPGEATLNEIVYVGKPGGWNIDLLYIPIPTHINTLVIPISEHYWSLIKRMCAMTICIWQWTYSWGDTVIFNMNGKTHTMDHMLYSDFM